MGHETERVDPGELDGLLRELRRLVELGTAATYAEWLAYHERKADLLTRIAAERGGLADTDEAADVAAEAPDRAESMRDAMAVGGGERSCGGTEPRF